MIRFIFYHFLILNIKFSIQSELINNKITNSQIECMIHNEKYQFEYLYQSADIEELIKSSIYTYPLGSVDNFDHIKWNLVLIDRKLNVFQLRSHKLDQFMCSTSKRVNLFGRMMDNRMEVTGDKACQWRLEKVANHFNNRTYKIWNMKYENELVYASNHFFKLDKNKRGVYLMSDATNNEFDVINYQNENSQFNWNIDCFMGQFLLV